MSGRGIDETDKAAAKSFLKALGGKAGPFASIANAMALVQVACLIAASCMLAKIIDGVAFEKEALASLLPEIVCLCVLSILRALSSGWGEYAGAKGAAAIKAHIRQTLGHRLLSTRKDADQKTGGIINAYVDGCDAIETYFAAYIPARLLMVATPLAIVSVVLLIDPISACIFFVTAPLIPLFMILIGKGAQDKSDRQWQRLGQMGGHFLDALKGMESLKFMGACEREGARIKASAETYRRDTMDVLKLAFLSSLTLEFFSTVSIALSAVLIGFRLLWGTLGFQDGLLVLMLAPEFYLPLRRMGALHHAAMDAQGAAEQIRPLLDKPSPAVPTTPVTIMNFVSLDFESVSFSYGDGPLILDKADFQIRAGETVALTGPSGGGKSTLVELALGLLEPTSGRILVNGVPLGVSNREGWWRVIGYVPQRPHLFSGSVRKNISLGLGAQDEDIDAYIRELGLTDLLQTRDLGEDGLGLSGGQIQRIAMARALIRKPSFLIMDEATAFLDRGSEALIAQTLARHSEGKTVLIAAHKADAINCADTVYLVQNGKIIRCDGQKKRRSA